MLSEIIRLCNLQHVTRHSCKRCFGEPSTETGGWTDDHLKRRIIIINNDNSNHKLSAPAVQREYAQNFNAVDKNDRDSADYTCSVRTHRWYLRIIVWLLDRAVFATYIYCVLSCQGWPSRRLETLLQCYERQDGFSN